VALPHVEDFAQFEAFNTAVNIATEDLSTDDDGDEGTLPPPICRGSCCVPTVPAAAHIIILQTVEFSRDSASDSPGIRVCRVWCVSCRTRTRDAEPFWLVDVYMQFHPRFRYEGEEEDSVENYTSRSPYPTVHLIRASIITAAREVPTYFSRSPLRSFVPCSLTSHAHALARPSRNTARTISCACPRPTASDYRRWGWSRSASCARRRR
jgi:hypothetical protein